MLQVKLGTTQSGGAGISTEVYASQLGLGPGDDFEILLSADQQPGNWFALDPDATFVHVRDYYFDWQPREPATFVIERLDTQGLPAASSPPSGSRRCSTTPRTKSSIRWPTSASTRRSSAERASRTRSATRRSSGGECATSSTATRSCRCPDDDALVVEIDPSDASMWDVMLYNRPWYEPLDFAKRVTSLNHRQVQTNADGTVRIVVANTDPGIANWLDTEGRAEVLATIRWFRPPAEPTVRAQLVPRAQLADHLPRDTVTVDARRAVTRCAGAPRTPPGATGADARIHPDRSRPLSPRVHRHPGHAPVGATWSTP